MRKALFHSLGVFVCGISSLMAGVVIDYPRDGSLFPPEFPAPQLVWRDSGNTAEWTIEVRFATGPAMSFRTRGESLRIGEIDQRCVAETNVIPKLTPEQAAARSWRPDPALWAEMKKRTTDAPAVIIVIGSSGSARVSLRTSRDPVGAPVFYRDVPLMPSEMKKGEIKPLAPSALPLIAWRLRDIAETRSRLLLTGMHTCANCHSFSRDGKTFGMDLDGPRNDKGLYAFVAVQPKVSIRTGDVISWDATRASQPAQSRVGFMSQVSPDGQAVLTTVHLARNATSNYYLANFLDYRFLQVFYPTQGILAWYSRATGERRPLPGADDTRYVQTGGVWSPDGKYIVFSRAEAREPYPAGVKQALRANDPGETQIQYDLYRLPFNGGKGGTAEPIEGASRNGMSNTFPKVSPDGKWIVFVKCRNGQLMRPDSELYIVPFQGGAPRRLRANLPLMNSWHSFSPNGRWLVFSSKGQSPYTQMFLTHLDEQGNDTPAILIENSTAANRAVNIPEFVNTTPAGFQSIEVPAVAFYEQFDRAWDFTEKADYAASIPEWRKAIELNPKDVKSHNNLGNALVEVGKVEEGIAEYRRAQELDPADPDSYHHLGVVYARAGRFDEAIPYLEKALALSPENPIIQMNLGGALASSGRRTDDAIRYLRKVLESNPNLPTVHVNLAIALSAAGNMDDAIVHLEKAAQLSPDNPAIESNLGAALAERGKTDEAIVHFEKALRIAPNFSEGHYNMVMLYAMRGSIPEALTHWSALLRLQPGQASALDQLAGRAAQLAGPRSRAFLDGALNAAVQQGLTPLAQALRARISK